MTAPAGGRVLLVDDDELASQSLGKIIASAGYSVTTAADGESALLALRDDFSSIAILDINMPAMDGLALCRTIRSRTYPSYVYLILYTAKDSDEDVLAGLEAGADDYLSKSTPQSQLIGRLRTARRILTLEHSLRSAIGEREQLAMIDPLTGAFNRRYLLQHLSAEVSRARRSRGELSLLVLDFDHFSEINDRYGHAAGDAALTELVMRIQASLKREGDWCARWGGDEFVAVLPQTDFAGASIMANKILAAVHASPMRTGKGISSVTVSIGISGLAAVGNRELATAETLLELADQCLYKSKRMGRNRVTLAAIEELIVLPQPTLEAMQARA